MKFPEWLAPGHQPARTPRAERAPKIDQWLQPLVRFLHVEAAGGIVLLACTALALLLANSSWSEWFLHLWHIEIGFQIGNLALNKPLEFWINDGLMTIFFFVVGLEIKREFVSGELQDPRKAALPLAAALGGMIVPALIYLLMEGGEPGQKGWGIPMATDIAFVVGFMALLGSRVPFGLKIMLLTLAIVDDIGSVLVIAVVYSSDLFLTPLALAVAGFALIFLLQRIGVRLLIVYIVIGAVIWFLFLQSGVHPTVAGVLLGSLTPSSSWFEPNTLLNVTEGVVQRLREDQQTENVDHHAEATDLLIHAARETVSPLDRLENVLHPWVAFGIMPVFALANAGVKIDGSAIANPVAYAVAVGLFLGKPLGIVGFSWIAVRLGVARLPTGVTWPVLLGGGCLAGIGFTMSLFIAGLALEGDLLHAGKAGTLIGSLASAIVGSVLLWLLLGERGA
jgi:NhaA family Na+:H+ antiporter